MRTPSSPASGSIMRADKYFAERFGSRTKAAEALKKGLVLRSGRPLSPDDEVKDDDVFTFPAPKEQFVSNGGYKLARGLDAFEEDVSGKRYCDLGASTGGFTDCLLQRGARAVVCVDVGESQLAPSLAADPRIAVMDGTNARYLKKEMLPFPVDGVVSDLSFISLELVLPAVRDILPAHGKAFVLFKPQFECGGRGLSKRGILPVPHHAALLDAFYDTAQALALMPRGIVNAPVRPQKNVEYVVFLEKEGEAIPKYRFLAQAARLV